MAVTTPAFLQVKPYTAKDVRAALMDLGVVQPGVVNANDYVVTQRFSGANMSVDVAAGSGWLLGYNSARQGLYGIYNDNTVNVAIPNNPAAAGTYRIDQVILRLYDSTDGGSVQDIGAIEVHQGTSSNAFASVTAALDARTGFEPIGATYILLADIAVQGGAASIGPTVIRDRRPWARGAYARMTYSGANLSTASTTMVPVNDNSLARRVECSGAPVKFTFSCQAWNSTAAAAVLFGLQMDGVALDSTTVFAEIISPAANQQLPVNISYTSVNVPAGSHVFRPTYSTAGSGTAILNGTNPPVTFTVEELLTQNSYNNTQSSG